MAISPIPEGLASVTPSLVVTPCADAIDFYVQAFGAVEFGPRMTGPDGLVGHAEIRIGNSVIMMGDVWPDGPTTSPTALGGTTCALFIYTDDARAMWQRAIDAGAEVIFPLQEQFYGDLSGRLRDPFGHTWGIGQRIEEVSEEEMARRVATFYEESAD